MAVSITQTGSLEYGGTAYFEIQSSASLWITWTITLNGSTYTDTSYENNRISLDIPWVPNKSVASMKVVASVEHIYSGSTETVTKYYNAKAPAPTEISVSPTTVNFGDEVTIMKGYSSPYFTHRLYYSLDGSSSTIITANGGSHNSTYTWTVPTDLASKITSGDSLTIYIQCWTYNGTASVGVKSATITAKIGTGTVPVLSTSSLYLGNALTISLPRASTSFTHDLQYKIMHNDSGGYNIGDIATGVATSYTWTVPLTLAFNRPSDKSFVIQLICKTYNGSSLIDTQSVEFTAIVPENSTTKPSIGTVQCTPVSDVLPASISNACFVEQKSKLQVLIGASGYGTTIASYSLSVGGSTITSISNVLVSPVLTVSGEVTVTVKVTDARGFTNTKNVTIQVVPYTKPRVAPASGQGAVIAARWNTASGVFDDSGLAVKILCARQYSPIIYNSTKYNSCDLKVRYMQADASGYGAWQTLLYADSSTDQVDKVLSGEFDATKEYLLQICVEDVVGESSILTLRIPAVGCTLHLGPGGMSVGIGQFASDEPHRIDMGWKAHMNKGVALREIYNGAAVEEGGEFEGADITTAKDYSLFVVVSDDVLGPFSLLGVKFYESMVCSYGSRQMCLWFREDSITLEVNTFSVKPRAIYALI